MSNSESIHTKDSVVRRTYPCNSNNIRDNKKIMLSHLHFRINMKSNMYSEPLGVGSWHPTHNLDERTAEARTTLSEQIKIVSSIGHASFTHRNWFESTQQFSLCLSVLNNCDAQQVRLHELLYILHTEEHRLDCDKSQQQMNWT